MITSDLPSADAFVQTLSEHGVLTPDALERVEAWRRDSPKAGSGELAAFLVEQGDLTRFQADVFLEDDPEQLTLSSYTLVDVLGTGSMGTVYKARSSRDDNWYAVKVVPRRNTIKLGSISEKVAALQHVRHPRVSSLVTVGAKGDRAYLVWPLVEGGEKLTDVVARMGRLPPRQAAQTALQIASGLQAYHDHDLFHGLLKASDVIIGSDRRVRLLDFGVGFVLTCDRGKALLDTMTNSKALARGLDCASPEAILDPLNRTPLGDQYSLGCILYFCLAGRYPFADEKPVQKMLAHQFHEPTPIRELVPDCPKKLASIVERLLRKQADDRYNCIGDLISELKAVASDPRLATGTITTSGPSSPGAIRPSERLGEQQAEPEESPTQAAGTMKKIGRGLLWLALAGIVAGGGFLAWYLAHR